MLIDFPTPWPILSDHNKVEVESKTLKGSFLSHFVIQMWQQILNQVWNKNTMLLALLSLFSFPPLIKAPGISNLDYHN
jgi:hypothetical protein